jgi:hypothetical protein
MVHRADISHWAYMGLNKSSHRWKESSLMAMMGLFACFFK